MQQELFQVAEVITRIESRTMLMEKQLLAFLDKEVTLQEQFLSWQERMAMELARTRQDMTEVQQQVQQTSLLLDKLILLLRTAVKQEEYKRAEQDVDLISFEQLVTWRDLKKDLKEYDLP